MDNIQEWITWAGVGIGAIIATVIARLGFTTKRSDPVAETNKALNLPVIVDSGALVRHTAAIEALNMSAIHGNKLTEEQNEITERLSRALEDSANELSRIREEIRLTREVGNARQK